MTETQFAKEVAWARQTIELAINSVKRMESMVDDDRRGSPIRVASIRHALIDAWDRVNIVDGDHRPHPDEVDAALGRVRAGLSTSDDADMLRIAVEEGTR